MFEGDVDKAADDDVWGFLGHEAVNSLQQGIDWHESVGAYRAKNAVDSRDVQLHYLYNLVMTEPSAENHQALMDEINYRMQVDETFKALNPNFTVGSQPSKIDFECYRELIDEFEAACFPLEEYSLKYAGQLVHECEGFHYFPEAKEQVIARFSEVCDQIEI